MPRMRPSSAVRKRLFDMAERHCIVCDAPIVRRDGEYPHRFNARRTCGISCFVNREGKWDAAKRARVERLLIRRAPVLAAVQSGLPKSEAARIYGVNVTTVRRYIRGVMGDA